MLSSQQLQVLNQDNNMEDFFKVTFGQMESMLEQANKSLFADLTPEGNLRSGANFIKIQTIDEFSQKAIEQIGKTDTNQIFDDDLVRYHLQTLNIKLISLRCATRDSLEDLEKFHKDHETQDKVREKTQDKVRENAETSIKKFNEFQARHFTNMPCPDFE